MACKCQQCGDSYEADKLVNGEICPTCDKPYQIKNYKAIAEMPPPQINKYITTIQTQLVENPQDKQLNSSLGICFLKLKLYDKALPFFEKAMEDNFSDSTPFYLATTCILKGQKPFVHNRQEIDKILEYINAAKMIEAKPIYEYFEAYVRYDYFGRKFIKINPTWQEVLQKSNGAGTTETEVEQLYQFLGVERPSCL